MNKQEAGRHFLVRLPGAPGTSTATEFPSDPQIDASGRVNYSTTELARTGEFRARVKEGRENAGLGSSFILSPRDLFEKSRKRGELKRLTRLQQRVLRLRYIDGLSQAEVSKRTNRNFRTVSKIERRALDKLEERVDGLGKEKDQARALLLGGFIDLSLVPTLTATQREILTLRYKEGLSGVQAAKKLQTDPRRVSDIENAALNKIARKLREKKRNQT